MKTLIEWRLGGPSARGRRAFIVATIERAIRAQLDCSGPRSGPGSPNRGLCRKRFPRQAPKAHAAWSLGALSSTIRTMSVMMRLSSKSFGV